jgi:hypothetical protein
MSTRSTWGIPSRNLPVRLADGPQTRMPFSLSWIRLSCIDAFAVVDPDPGAVEDSLVRSVGLTEHLVPVDLSVAGHLEEDPGTVVRLDPVGTDDHAVIVDVQPQPVAEVVVEPAVLHDEPAVVGMRELGAPGVPRIDAESAVVRPPRWNAGSWALDRVATAVQPLLTHVLDLAVLDQRARAHLDPGAVVVAHRHPLDGPVPAARATDRRDLDGRGVLLDHQVLDGDVRRLAARGCSDRGRGQRHLDEAERTGVLRQVQPVCRLIEVPAAGPQFGQGGHAPEADRIVVHPPGRRHEQLLREQVTLVRGLGGPRRDEHPRRQSCWVWSPSTSDRNRRTSPERDRGSSRH